MAELPTYKVFCQKCDYVQNVKTIKVAAFRAMQHMSQTGHAVRYELVCKSDDDDDR